MQEILLALQIERRYTKPQIFTMYANQVYLAHGNYGFAAAAQFYFGKPVTDLNFRKPRFSPAWSTVRSFHRSRIRNSRLAAAIW